MVETPHIVLAVFVEQPTPFIEEFFRKLSDLNYPKAKIDLFVHNAIEYHSKDVEEFVNASSDYHSIEIIDDEDNEKEWHARNAGIQHCADLKCDYYFSVDATAHIDNPETLKLLIEQNRDVIAPVMIRPYHAWSNFWGALNKEGFYGRSTDYMDIVNSKRRGLWNVPFISAAYLIKGSLINDAWERRPNFVNGMLDADMAFCANLRAAGVFMYASNRMEFGHLIHTDGFDTSHLNNELWEIGTNRYDWEKRYLHSNYSQNVEEEATFEQPCPDVYWFPIVSDRFADELVAEMEHYGRWSDGSNSVKELRKL